MDPECDFCEEFQSPQLSLFSRIFAKYGISSRIVLEEDNFLAITGLGALTEGYMLLLPRRHVLALGSLSLQELGEFTSFKKKVLSLLGAHYQDLICFEHGAASKQVRGGACIDHAHLHICPCPVDLSLEISKQFPGREIENLEELCQFPKSGMPYLYYEDQKGSMTVYSIPHTIRSQYLRKLWAEAIGKANKWDWAAHIGEEEIIRTLGKLQSLGM